MKIWTFSLDFFPQILLEDTKMELASFEMAFEIAPSDIRLIRMIDEGAFGQVRMKEKKK